jgi:hypothetical protein
MPVEMDEKRKLLRALSATSCNRLYLRIEMERHLDDDDVFVTAQPRP